MLDFRCYNPVRVHFGKESLGKLTEELAQVGKKVLLAYGGGSIKRSGLYDKVIAALNETGKEVYELTGIMPNPRTEKVYEGIEICKKNGIEISTMSEKDVYFINNWEAEKYRRSLSK